VKLRDLNPDWIANGAGIGFDAPNGGGRITVFFANPPRIPMADGLISWSPDGTRNFQAGCTEARNPDGSMRRECVYCYARGMSARLREMGQPRYQDATTDNGSTARWTGRLTWDREAMRRAFADIKAGKRMFVGSMTDLWHDDCDPAMHEALAEELATVKGIPMMLTKRVRNLRTFQRRYFPAGFPPNVWIGITAGTQAAMDQDAHVLQTIDGGLIFASMEPLTEAVTLRSYVGRNAIGIQWVIVGAESRTGKPGAPMDLDWVRQLRDETKDAGAAFFFKQSAVNGRIVNTPVLDGRTWTEVPNV